MKNIFFALLIIIAIALGLHFHYIVFDPLNLLTIVILLFTAYSNKSRQQQIANHLQMSYKTLYSNQKELHENLKALRAEVKKR